MTHNELVDKAVRWLKSMGCGVVVDDRNASPTSSGEHPDAIGWRDGLSLLVECKTSRADFLADARKPFRMEADKGMGDWRFFMAPIDVIRPDELPAGWGLVYVEGRRVVETHNVPPSCNWYVERPFIGNKQCETQVLCTAFKKLQAQTKQIEAGA